MSSIESESEDAADETETDPGSDAEIEVEAVDSLDADEVTPEGLDAPEYVLYGGKGGVGKTTMAAASALASANDGTPTLAVSTDPAHSLSDVLETDVPSEPSRVREDVPLYAVEIDPEAADSPLDGAGLGAGMGGAGDADGAGGLGGLGGMGVDEGLGEADALFGGMNPMSAGAMPGADESAAMQLLLEYLDDDRFERVVVDTAPTGHTLRLLQLPEALDSMMGRVLQFRERLSGLLGDAPGPFGDDGAADVRGLREFADRIERLRAALQDPERTDFRVVMVPERLSVVESERLLRDLDDFGIPVSTLVVNRVTESLANVVDVEEGLFVTPDPENCEFCATRWESQQAALARAQETFRGRDVKRVPLFAEEVHGEAMLRVVAACLE